MTLRPTQPVSLTWDSDAGATAGYDLYLNGQKVSSAAAGVTSTKATISSGDLFEAVGNPSGLRQQVRVSWVSTNVTPPPPSPIGYWDATKGVVDANSASKISNMLATAGTPYFYAAIARAYATSSTPFYAVPTQESVKSVSAPIPPNTQVGHTFDGLLIVMAPPPAAAHEQNVAAFLSDQIALDEFEKREGERLAAEQAQETAALAGATIPDIQMTRYSFGNAVASGGKITKCFGATIMAPGTFTEPRPNSTSAGRMPDGYVTPEDYANDVMASMVFSTANVGPGPAVYPADTSYGYPGNTGLNLGSWIRLPPTLALDPALTKFENYICRRFQACGAFLRDIGSSFNIYGTDQCNQGGQVHDWGAVGVTLEITNNGYPYAHKWSSAYVATMKRLQLLLPPAR